MVKKKDGFFCFFQTAVWPGGTPEFRVCLIITNRNLKKYFFYLLNAFDGTRFALIKEKK